jgi:hypothetical protein
MEVTTSESHEVGTITIVQWIGKILPNLVDQICCIRKCVSFWQHLRMVVKRKCLH